MTKYNDAIYDIHNNSLDIKNRIIYLHSYVTDSPDDDDPGIDYRVANKFIKNLHILENMNSNPILIYLSSIGGCVYNAMSIYDNIKNSKVRIAIIGHGIIASAATIILQAADTRILYPSTNMLIHDIFTASEGKRLDVLNHTYQLKKDFNIMLDIYTNSMINGPKFAGKSFTQIRSFLIKKLKNNPELYLSANDAVEWGVADGIFGVDKYNSIDTIKNGV